MIRTKDDFRRDLMVTDDDAGSLHWRGQHCRCEYNGCVAFFGEYQLGRVEDLYPPWRELYEKAP